MTDDILLSPEWNRPIPGLAQFLAASNFDALDGYNLNAAGVLFAPVLKTLSPADPARKGRVAWLAGDSKAAHEAFQSAPADRGLGDLWYAQALIGSPNAATRLAGIDDSAVRPRAEAWRGWLALSAGRLDEALVALDRAVGLDPKLDAAHLLRGLALDRSGRRADAARAYAAAAANDPACAGLSLLQGRALAAAGDEDGAAEAFDEAAARWPEAMAGFLRLAGDAEDAPGRHALDAEITRRLEERAERGAWWAHGLLAAYRPSFGDPNAAHARRSAHAARAKASRPRSVWILSQCARLAWGADLAAAEKLMDEAVKLRPAIGWLKAWRGEIRARQGKPDAEGDFEEGMRLSPGYSHTYAWRASARLRAGDAAAAAAGAARALELNPGLALAHWVRARLAADAGRWAEAVEALSLSTVNDPGAKRTLGAQEALEPLAALMKGHDEPAARAALWRGELLLRAKRHPEAEQELARAEAGPLNPVLAGWAAAFRADALAALGRAQDAAKARERAVALNPDSV